MEVVTHTMEDQPWVVVMCTPQWLNPNLITKKSSRNEVAEVPCESELKKREGEPFQWHLQRSVSNGERVLKEKRMKKQVGEDNCLNGDWRCQKSFLATSVASSDE